MGEGLVLKPQSTDLLAVNRIQSLGESLPDIAMNFKQSGAMGLILIDAAALDEVERSFGCEAHERATNALGAQVADLISDRLGICDMIVTGETGRNEIVVLVYRGPDEAEFYRRELPILVQKLSQGFSKPGLRVGYPYLRRAAALTIGSAAALRNPTCSPETQLRAALEEARQDADLSERIAARRRRQRLFDLVLEGKVRSVYEPIVDVSTHTVFGYEALARGPEGSELHSPAALFSSAEEVDLLFQLDCLCRKSALDGARDFPRESKLFVNVRPTTIHDPSFQAESLSRTLEKCNLRPSDVVFEISEQESIENFEIFREVRDYYGKLGLQIALDDVGAGYASLESVLELSPDYIKVDRAFVAGIDEDPMRQELLRALQLVAEKINAKIIGEGLDTLEELQTLGRLGISFGQGWLFGKPHPLRSDT
jgi:EAL domain-containing protein (putative c-di-GMP-specific phosphodiesterase class I)